MKADLRDATRPAAAKRSLVAKELFRARFQRALRSCVQRRFSVAECFGVIWMETLEEFPLTDPEQSALYEELMDWAKQRLFREVVHSHSPHLFTDRTPALQEIPGA